MFFLCPDTYFFSCLALPKNRSTAVHNSANIHHDLNKQQEIIIVATLPCILVPAALLISYITIKRLRKRLENEQLLMDDQIEAYTTTPSTTDNITLHLDNEEFL